MLVSRSICLLWFLSNCLLIACRMPVINTNQRTLPVTQSTQPLRYLALGDSYTIGHGVAESERWPVQLVARLRAQQIPIADPLIIARTGWTTGDLLAGIAQAQPQGPFDLVTLLIGVNNQYRHRGLDEYREQFKTLLTQAITFAGGEATHLIVLSIPDWGVTPFATGRDRPEIAVEIDRFNAINRAEAQQVGAQYVDVTPISRQAATDPTLLASDQLHPAGKMYAAWVDLVLPLATMIGERH
jgi:lysophospholipase L1-like esterase